MFELKLAPVGVVNILSCQVQDGAGGVGSSDPSYGAIESTSSVKVAVVVSKCSYSGLLQCFGRYCQSAHLRAIEGVAGSAIDRFGESQEGKGLCSS